MIEIPNINARMFQHMRNLSHMYVCKIKERIITWVLVHAKMSKTIPSCVSKLLQQGAQFLEKKIDLVF